MRLRRALAARQLAVDLGTANTVVYQRGEGIVLFEPSVVAFDQRTGVVQAVGDQARQMIGRTPAHISATRPLRHGVIADFDTTEQMLRHFIRKVAGRNSRARVMVCVPSGITGVERSAVEEATLAAGARSVDLIDEPLAGAIGAGLPVAEPVGSLVVDIGGGTSEMAVAALGGMVAVHSIPVGGYELDDAIVRAIQQREKLLIGQEQAETLKIAIGSALPQAERARTGDVAGRDLVTGLLRRTTVEAGVVREAFARPLGLVIEAVKELLERTPAELSSDIAARGLTLVGGGALLPGLDALLRRETGLPVATDDAPLTTVARGAGQALEALDSLHRRRRQHREPIKRR